MATIRKIYYFLLIDISQRTKVQTTKVTFLFQEEEGEIYFFAVKIWSLLHCPSARILDCTCNIRCMKLVGEMETVEVNQMYLL